MERDRQTDRYIKKQFGLLISQKDQDFSFHNSVPLHVP